MVCDFHQLVRKTGRHSDKHNKQRLSYACAGSDYGDFKNLDFYSRGSYTPKVGDLIFFDWLDGDQYVWDHVEIVIGVDSSNVTTLGGNTGTNDVKTRNWNLSHQYIKGYGVPKYTSGSNPTPTLLLLLLRAVPFRI